MLLDVSLKNVPKVLGELDPPLDCSGPEYVSITIIKFINILKILGIINTDVFQREFHPAGFRVPDSRAPSRSYPSELQLVPHG